MDEIRTPGRGKDLPRSDCDTSSQLRERHNPQRIKSKLLDSTPRLSIDTLRESWGAENLSTAPLDQFSKPKHNFPWRTGGFILFPFYRFIKSPSFKEVDAEAAKLLEQRGCFHVPTKTILEEFMENYFLYFHPLVPLLDEQQFWPLYDGQNSTNGYISLFVLQAMLFVSCPYVPLQSIISLGFRTIKEAQDEFYLRARTLFDLQSTIDDQDRAQGAMMLTYRTMSFNDTSPLYWLSIAIHYAKNADAHRYHERRNSQEGSLLKRLWWCCVLRDQILALALRRPQMLSLTKYDFGYPGLTFDDFAHEIEASRVYDAAAKRIIVHVAIVLCKLGIILSNIPPVSEVVKGHELCNDEIEDVTSKLDDWYDETYAIFRLPTAIFGVPKSLLLFSNVLCTYYHTAKALVYNHTLLNTAEISRDGLEDFTNARLMAHTNLGCCLRSITENMAELEHSGLVKYLPITFINFSATPFIWYLLQSQMESSDDTTQQDLKAHIDIMDHFSHLYENAQSTIECIKKIVEHIKVNEPLPVNSNPHAGAGAVEGGLQPTALLSDSWSGNALGEILLDDPRKYLRIALTIELSLARGRCPPADEDFPQWLRSHDECEGTACSDTSTTTTDAELCSLFFHEAMYKPVLYYMEGGC